MSFGFGIGDAVAILDLLKRVAEIVHSYRDAPQHFQNLGVELQLLHRALQRLFEVQPCCEDERQQLEQIRAIAMHCQQPLLAFIDKMRPSETSLGPMRSLGALSTIRKRVHWSLVTRKDVNELRQVLISEMAAINMLLAVQQLDSLKRLAPPKDNSDSAHHLHKFHSTSSEYFRTSMALLQKVGKTPDTLDQLQMTVSQRLSNQEQMIHETNEQMSTISTVLTKSKIRIEAASTVVRSIEGHVLHLIRTIASTADDIGKIIVMFATIAKDIAGRIASQG